MVNSKSIHNQHENSELKPCPFCGGEAYIKSYLPCDGYMGESTRYRVGCDSCGVTVEKCTKEHAIDTWNTRTPNEKKEFKE